MLFDYTLKRNRRVRGLRITVKHSGEVVVTAPVFVAEYKIEKFIKERESWVQEVREKFKKRFENKIILKQNKLGLKEAKAKALEFVLERIKHFNQFYNFTVGQVRIKNQASRWGSCSKRGNLNFNYNIINIEQDIADYIVVHELCHLKEFNHSQQFWNLVEKTIPNYQELRKKLKNEYVNIG